MTEKKDHIIDASGQKLGRVVSEAVVVLMGKDTPDFERNVLAGRTVKIENASKLSISDKKLDQKEYVTFSGYPGGQKKTTMRKQLEKKGYEDIIRKAVYGMLPVNRLRSRLMRRLIVTE